MRRFIITGAPGAGKTAIVRQLELDGFSVVEEAATDVIAVGRTNRAALTTGAPAATSVPGRAQAVAWVRDNLGPGDVVVYVNDHPDHYP